MASFTSVLKKIGQVLITGGEVVSQVMGFPFVAQLLGQLSPKTQQIVQTATSDFNALAGIATMLETAMPTTGSGSARVAAGAPLVANVITLWAQSNLPGHSKVKDPAMLAEASAGILANFAKAMNAFGE